MLLLHFEWWKRYNESRDKTRKSTKLQGRKPKSFTMPVSKKLFCSWLSRCLNIHKMLRMPSVRTYSPEEFLEEPRQQCLLQCGQGWDAHEVYEKLVIYMQMTKVRKGLKLYFALLKSPLHWEKFVSKPFLTCVLTLDIFKQPQSDPHDFNWRVKFSWNKVYFSWRVVKLTQL